MIKVGSDFSGVGAFNQALIRLGIEYDEVFACDMDKYARETFIHNYGEPKYYPKDVYERDIPKESLDIYMTSPPCQAFSLAGKRLGKDDKRGVLFFNSHEFIKTNKPRYFIFENVKGLLSDDNGNTFKEWVNMLGGKSVNGLPVLFPYEDSVPYHIYYKVMNAKKHGVPQNRERVFIIGIRDDQDNTFRWAKEEHLTKRLKDVLENEILYKYLVTEDGIKNLKKNQKYNKFNPLDKNSKCTNTITSRCNKISNDNPFVKVDLSKYYLSDKSIQGIINSDFTSKSRIIQNKNNYCATLLSRDYKDPKCVKVKSANKKGYEEANEGVAQTLDTAQGGGIQPHTLLEKNIRRLTPRECFRLMDFPDTFTWICSDSQAYKQAGNSIVVRCLELIIKEFNL